MKTAVHRPRGIRNLGNTCFMNSVLQTLAGMKGFKTFVEERVKYFQNRKANLPPVLLALSFTMKELCPTQTNETFEPTKMMSTVPVKRLVKEREQQDAQELFALVMSALDEELESSPACLPKLTLDEEKATFFSASRGRFNLGSDDRLNLSSSSDNQPNGLSIDYLLPNTDTKVTPSRMKGLLSHSNQLGLFDKEKRNPFTGLLASQLYCNKCHRLSSLNYHKFNDLSLSIPQKACSVEDCLKDFTASETVEGVECDHCTGHAPVKVKAPATKRLFIGRPPVSLCLHLRRLTQRGKRILKADTQVVFKTQLNMSPYCEPSSEKASSNDQSLSSLFYKLVGVIVHQGSAMGGHYLTYRKLGYAAADPWFRFSDAEFLQVEEKEVLQQQAYMLFYEKEITIQAPVQKPSSTTTQTYSATRTPSSFTSSLAQSLSSSTSSVSTDLSSLFPIAK